MDEPLIVITDSPVPPRIAWQVRVQLVKVAQVWQPRLGWFTIEPSASVRMRVHSTYVDYDDAFVSYLTKTVKF